MFKEKDQVEPVIETEKKKNRENSEALGWYHVIKIGVGQMFKNNDGNS